MNEFRYNYDTKHMNYIFEEDGKKYHSLGLTTDSETFGKNNMPLKHNAQKNKTKKSYIRNGYITQNKKSYAKHKDKRFSFSSEDIGNVKSKIRHFKNSRRKRK